MSTLGARLFPKDRQAARALGDRWWGHNQRELFLTTEIHVMTLLSQSRARKKVPVRSPACLSAEPHIKSRQRETTETARPSLSHRPACTFSYCRPSTSLLFPFSPSSTLPSLFHFSCQLRVDSLAKAKIHSSPRLVFCGFCSFPCSGQGSSTRTQLLGGNSPIQLTLSPSIL